MTICAAVVRSNDDANEYHCQLQGGIIPAGAIN